jgi:Family of unknown function (DUF5829)
MMRSLRTILLMTVLATGAFAQSTSPAIYLNHLFVVLDSETYAAMVNNTLLRQQFAPSVVRTTARTDITYTGLYFFGKHTYIELFDAKDSPSGKHADSAIAFGVEQPGALAAIQAASQGELGKVVQIQRPYEGRQIPWFSMASSSETKAGSPLSLWLMEYDPEYLHQFYPQLAVGSAPPVDITRAGALTRMRSTLPPVRDPLLEDVFEITVAADSVASAQLSQMAKVLGLAESRSGTTTTLEGTDFSIVVVPGTDANHGIRKLRMHALPSPSFPHDLEVGNVHITSAKNEVDWVWK